MNRSRKTVSRKTITGNGNKAIEIINVTTKAQLDYLYEQSALSIEGFPPELIPDFMQRFKKDTKVKRERVFIIKGKVMNKTYHLTGSNAYQDNFNIISIALDDIDPWPIIHTRFLFGGRWFDDIVDNNLRRERNKDNHRNNF